jgi:hypothetical protein
MYVPERVPEMMPETDWPQPTKFFEIASLNLPKELGKTPLWWEAGFEGQVQLENGTPPYWPTRQGQRIPIISPSASVMDLSEAVLR